MTRLSRTSSGNVRTVARSPSPMKGPYRLALLQFAMGKSLSALRNYTSVRSSSRTKYKSAIAENGFLTNFFTTNVEFQNVQVPVKHRRVYDEPVAHYPPTILESP